MAMKELMRVTLDEAQIREACEEAVRARLSRDMQDENVRAVMRTLPGEVSGTATFQVDVVVTRKRDRERKQPTAKDAL